MSAEKKRLRNTTDSLLFGTALTFGFFIIVTLLMSAITVYIAQMKAYKAECIQNIRKIGDYLERQIQNSGQDFIAYQNYYMEHFAEADIPYEFDEYLEAQKNYEAIIAKTNPEFFEQKNMDFDSLSDEAKMAYFIYIHEYWILTFENARKAFNLPYTYYLVPKEKIYHMVYMIDGERTPKDQNGDKAESGKYLYLGDEYFDPPEKYKVQWRAWFTGERQDDFETWNNEWGHTYAYYTPLIIDGQKLGLIGTEIEVADVNKTILTLSIKIAGAISLCLVFFIVIIMLLMNKLFIKKVLVLESQMREYKEQKDPAIADKIRAQAKGNNEIASLSRQFADLILELEQHMNNLLSTKKELKDTKQLAQEMNELAKKDALTGVRNKTAYNSEADRLELGISEGKRDFGIAMVDLNFLKKINDNYGHEQGDAAIKKLCHIICHTFKHSPVFRIGGDEFAIVLEKEDFENIENLVQKFNAQLDLLSKDENLQPWEYVSAALGYALFRPNDTCVADVFRRADQNMYERKKQMKAERAE